MKANNTITLTAVAAISLISGSATAQQMSFNDNKLVSGSDLEVGAAYRFANVTSGMDAIVTVDALENAKITNIDARSGNSISDEGWNPTFVGTAESGGSHYADFSIVFYANGTNDRLAPSQFTTTIFGNDFSSNPSTGFNMEFIQVQGATWVLSPSDILGEDSPWLSDSKVSQLAIWNFEDKPGYNIRYGWQGDNSERSFNAMMLNIPDWSETLSKQFDLGLAQNLTLTTVPEPSTSFLFVLSVFPLAFRRKRQKKSSK